MPEMDGFKATKEILNLDPDQKVIALSAFTNNSVKERCQKKALISFKNKPIDSIEFKKLILIHIFNLTEE